MANKKKGVSLAVGRGEKLPVSKGAGLTAKGRAKYNAATEAVFFRNPLLESEKWQGFMYVDLT